VDSAGVAVQVGGDIACAQPGSTGSLALTETVDGLRLAQGCTRDFNNGAIRIVDFNGTSWNEVGDSPLDIDAVTLGTNELYGFSISLSSDGTRLAASAPNFSGASVSDGGLTRVYDLDAGTNTWTTIGSDIVGTEAVEKLGFAISLSSDGTTLAVGSPNKDSATLVDAGALKIYTLASTTASLVEEIFGDAADYKLGFGVALNDDGTTMVASCSSTYNSNGGQVRVFDLSSSPAAVVGVFDGDSGDQITSIALSTGSSRFATGSIGADTNGIVQVFDSFTLAPSLAPSASPAPTVDNNLNMTKFDWDIFALPDLTEIELSEDAETSEIILHYNISIRDTKIQAFESDCETPIPDSVTSLTSESITTSTTHTNFSIAVDIHQDTIMDYPSVWTDVDVGQGLISICVRLDLVLDDPAETSVNFYEQKLFVNVGLLSGFTVTGIDLTRLEATEETGTADVEYNVTACHCNAARTCIDAVLTQGSDVYLCVETTAANIEISEIRDLTMAQGAFNTTPIVDGVPDALTFVTINGKEASIRYQIISAFFADAFPADIVATGQALLSFTDDNGRRLLRTSRINIVQPDRELELLEEDDFKVTMAVQGSELESSGTFACGFASVIVIMVSGVVAVL
jgi:WD40 repeat protein